MDYTTVDSGERVDFITGSRRDSNKGKPRYDLIGRWLLKRLAALMARGAEKYGENNWLAGQPISRSYESLFRHMIQWRDGDTTEDHASAVAFNIGSIIHVQEEIKAGRLPKELWDLDVPL